MHRQCLVGRVRATSMAIQLLLEPWELEPSAQWQWLMIFHLRDFDTNLLMVLLILKDPPGLGALPDLGVQADIRCVEGAAMDQEEDMVQVLAEATVQGVDTDLHLEAAMGQEEARWVPVGHIEVGLKACEVLLHLAGKAALLRTVMEVEEVLGLVWQWLLELEQAWLPVQWQNETIKGHHRLNTRAVATTTMTTIYHLHNQLILRKGMHRQLLPFMTAPSAKLEEERAPLVRLLRWTNGQAAPLDLVQPTTD